MHRLQRDCGNPRGHEVNLRSGPQMREYGAIVERIKADGPSRILDWGCGYGQVSDLLWQAGVDVTPFDYRPDADEVVQPLEHYPHLRVHLSPDPHRLPFADGAFDAVLSCGVLEHVENPDASLDEISRILVPRGTFYVYKLPNRLSYLEAIARLAGLYYHGAYQFDRVYDEDGARALLARHGFVVQESRLTNILPLTLTGPLAQRAAGRIWKANQAASTIPCLMRFATNIELVAHNGPARCGQASPIQRHDARESGPPLDESGNQSRATRSLSEGSGLTR
jgi:SAM-dependent methyltransferase